MQYQVIARKFRPQTFDDVIGQRPIVQTLQNAIRLNRVGHAYLFCGPRGVGKTTTARILAKGLNCSTGPTVSPCNTCASCREISAGQAMDVLEIDAASNTGVDSVRELRENARYAPSRDRHKVFIIDEVHMLSTSAFNALLKILEEPPAHVVFIMATTEKHKVPATILSRCQQFVFRSIAPEEIHQHLSDIANREKVSIDPKALQYVVRAAEGSMRDAQSLLDQIISFTGQSVRDKDVREVLGFVPDELIDATIQAVSKQDSATLFANVEAVVEEGLNLQQFVRELTSKFRDLLLVKAGVPERVAAGDREGASRLADPFSEQDLLRHIDLLIRLDNDLRWTAQARFAVEGALMKMARMGHIRPIEEVLRELRREGQPIETRPERPAPPPINRPARVSPAAASVTPAEANASAPAKADVTIQSPPEPAPTMEADDPIERLKAKVEDASIPTSVHLNRAQRLTFQGGVLRVEFESKSLLDLIDSPEHRRIVEVAATEVLGQPVEVHMVLSGEKKSRSPEALLESAKSEPLVKNFLEVFRGDLAHVKPTPKD